MAKNVLVVLNYNDFDTCKRLLEKVKDYSVFEKIIVVDNCSTDDSFQRLKSYENIKIDVIKSSANKGYAFGNNFGANYAIRKYKPQNIFIANPDVMFDETAAIRMAKALDRNSSIGIIAPVVKEGYNAWTLPDYWGTIKSLFLVLNRLERKKVRKKVLAGRGVQTVGAVEGSFFAVSADAFSKINGMDDRTFLYGEENILAYRLKQINCSAAILSDCYYEHLHSQSIKKAYGSRGQAFKHYYKSFKLYLIEYLKANMFQLILYEIAYRIAYGERIVCERIIWRDND